MRKVLEITFSGEEFRVVTADTPDAALKKARSEKPSLFLVDVTLPGQDGYAFCKTLKSEFPGVPVLILSSKQGPYDSAKGSAAGADEFADKPFDTQQLIDKVKRVLQNKGAAKVEAAPAPAPTPATKPGGGTLPGAAPVTSANAPRAGAPQTQNFGSSSRSPGATQVGVGPSLKPASPTLGTQPDTRTRTASGLGTAAAQAQAQAQKPTQPPNPAQNQPTPKPPPAVEAPAPEAAPPAAPSPVAAAVDAQLGEKIAGLGLSPAQADAVLALSREVVERIVWEVVPVLAETLIKEEIKRLTSE
jgi:DNA-binding response OmpR family regulator